jgi:cytochrome c2
MPRPLKTAWVLLTSAAILTFALTGFTLLNLDNIQPETVTNADNLKSAAVSEAKLEGEVLAGQLVFKANCKTCHGIDNRIIGPPLKHVYSHRETDWLKRWITNSSKMVAAGDPAAVQLFEEYNKTQMTNFSTMKKEDLDALLSYLKYVDEN